MALSTVTSIFSVQEARVTPVTADPSGGTTTYGTSLQLPGIQTVAATFDTVTANLDGDNRRLIVRGAFKGASVTATNAQLNLAVIAAAFGGTLTQAGTTPNQINTTSLSGGTNLPFFKFEARVLGIDGAPTTGDFHIILWKSLMVPTTVGGQQDQFNAPSTTFTGMARLSDSKVMDLIENETAVALV